MLPFEVFGLDLGSQNIKLYRARSNEWLSQRNLIAVLDDTYVAATGDTAYEMYERAPENIKIHAPVQGGTIASLAQMEHVLQDCLAALSMWKGLGSTCFVTVPSATTQVEKLAYFKVLKSPLLRARKVWLLESGLTDLAYAGVDFSKEQGHLVVNIGSATTVVTMTYGAKIVRSKKLLLGGDQIDQMIVDLLRERYHIQIGLKSAEQLKKEVLSLHSISSQMHVRGVHSISGYPSETNISVEVIISCIRKFFQQVIAELRRVIEGLPPEMYTHVQQNGLYLTGGQILIGACEKMFQDALFIPIQKSDRPLFSSIRGLEILIENGMYKKIGKTI